MTKVYLSVKKKCFDILSNKQRCLSSEHPAVDPAAQVCIVSSDRRTEDTPVQG